MKINEVEALVGITKKNIRFYEAEGLLTPRRNSENGYRDYGDADVAVLRRIKLLRKLGVPLEEIRQMQSGAHTVGDGMRRHLVTLEREQENLAAAARLCAGLTECREKLETLDAQALLEQMDEMEQRGTTFQNKQRLDIRFRYVAPVVITLLTVALMGSIGALMAWGYVQDAENAPPLAVVVALAAIRGAVTGIAVRLLAAAVLVWIRRGMPDGVLSVLFLALILVELGSIVPTIVVLKQRLNEIEGGEEDAAAQY